MLSKYVCKLCYQQLQRSGAATLTRLPYRLGRQAIAAENRTFTSCDLRKGPSNQAAQVAPQTPTPAPGKAPAKPDRAAPRSPSGSDALVKAALRVRNLAPGATATYAVYGVCEQLVKECTRVANYTIPQAADPNVEIPKNEQREDVGVGKGWWFECLKLPPTFNSWAQVSLLHMYLLLVRLRCISEEVANFTTWNQHLTNHFFYAAEDRMMLMHRIHSKSIRSRYLKDLFSQWRGMTLAYDEGLVRGDAVIASAVWRNVCQADENVDCVRLAEVVSYMRSVLSHLDKMDDHTLLTGNVAFGDPSGEEGLVKLRSSQVTDGVAQKSQQAKRETPANSQRKSQR